MCTCAVAECRALARVASACAAAPCTERSNAGDGFQHPGSTRTKVHRHVKWAQRGRRACRPALLPSGDGANTRVPASNHHCRWAQVEPCVQRYDFLSATMGAAVCTTFFVARGQDPVHALAITFGSAVFAVVRHHALSLRCVAVASRQCTSQRTLHTRACCIPVPAGSDCW